MANAKISALTSATTPLAGTETLPIVQSSTTKQVSVANLTAGRAVSASSLTATSGGVSVKGGPTGYGGDEIAMTTTASSFSAISTQMVGGTLYFDHRGTGNNANWVWRNGTGASTIRMIMGATGDLTVSTGNVIIGTSGKGIDFSATPGTGTSELLADYEEGTWTPTVSGTGTAGTYQIGTNGCTYTKIGRTVTLQGFIQFAAVVTGGGTGSLQITGLPFSKTANSYPAGSVYLATGVYVGIDPIVVFGSFSASSQLLLQQNASGGFGTAVGIGFASANAYLAFTLSYEV
jgi:hypothetical protein